MNLNSNKRLTPALVGLSILVGLGACATSGESYEAADESLATDTVDLVDDDGDDRTYWQIDICDVIAPEQVRRTQTFLEFAFGCESLTSFAKVPCATPTEDFECVSACHDATGGYEGDTGSYYNCIGVCVEYPDCPSSSAERSHQGPSSI